MHDIRKVAQNQYHYECVTIANIRLLRWMKRGSAIVEIKKFLGRTGIGETKCVPVAIVERAKNSM